MDCYDSCRVEYKDGACKPSYDKITNGKLCAKFAFMNQEEKLEDMHLLVTLEKMAQKLKEPNKKILYYKGSGNLGVMQNITKRFFETIKATIATGSLCENAGTEGINLGRDFSVNPTIKELEQSEVVLVWGRNLTETSKHIYRLIEDKIFITIDPMKTNIASKSEVYLQIPPKGDYLLAKIMQNALDGKDIDEKSLDVLNITAKQFNEMINLLKTKKVSVLLGVGAQKYKEGASIFHEMDKVFDKLGLFNGKNTGVWYLGDSKYAFEDKINITATNTCTYPDVKFDDYDIVFIQGANPVVSAPNTGEIIKSLKKTFVIFMGTAKNDTSKYADIIIPAKTYLQKKDVKLSYGHDEINICEVCEENENAISEYELTSYLFNAFNLDGLLSEDEYLYGFKKMIRGKPDIAFKPIETRNVPMLNLKENEYYLLTSKSKNTLNSSFKYDEYAYVNPKIGLQDGDKIKISSIDGNIDIKIKNDNSIYDNAILIYAGNKQVNYLTSNDVSEYGDNATLQDVKLVLEKV